MDRRTFMGRGVSGGVGLVLTPAMLTAAHHQAAVPGAGPYGSLEGVTPDASGVVLPEGFTARVIATTGDPVEGTDYVWPGAPDGGATFADGDGWIYVSNSEVREAGGGGVSAVRFDDAGSVSDAYRTLGDTSVNCAGGPTPWGTWLSCEEFDFHDDPASAELFGAVAGQVWETDPNGVEPAVALPAMGLFQHEAVGVDPVHERIYMTEDQPDGRLYRYTPTAYPDLTEGTLEVGALAGDSFTWLPLPDPSAAGRPTRTQVPESTAFAGGEGLWFHEGVVYFTTKLDNKVHALDTDTDAYRVVYDAAELGDSAPLRGVDNITVENGSGDLFVAEDGGSMQIVLITPEGEVAPFLAVTGQESSEITGPAFSPDGSRLYFSSQRGTDGRGITYEVAGPFRGVALAATGATTTSTPADNLDAASGDGASDDDSAVVPLAVGGVIAAAAVAGGLAVLMRRRSSPEA